MRFVDTSFWAGLFSAGDDRHEAARAVWASQPEALLSTNHVLGETWTLLRRRYGYGQATAAVDAIGGSPRVSVIHVEKEAEAAAWQWLRRHKDREYSFVDATSFVTMNRRRLTEVLAFDGDFSAAGFIEVRP